MQEATHILEMAFETSILVGGLFYLSTWIGGRKLTNGQTLLVFAFSLGVFFLLNFFSSASLNLFSSASVYVVFTALALPAFVRRLWRTRSLNSKPLSTQINAGSKDPMLPEQTHLPETKPLRSRHSVS